MSNVHDETMGLVYSRNKWHMLCSHFGESSDESCAATFIDRIESLTAERDEAIAAKEQMAAENERLKQERAGAAGILGRASGEVSKHKNCKDKLANAAAELATLRARLEAMEKPVSDGEMNQHSCYSLDLGCPPKPTPLLTKDEATYLIYARAQKGGA